MNALTAFHEFLKFSSALTGKPHSILEMIFSVYEEVLLYGNEK